MRLYLFQNGLDAQQRRMSVISNNLANVSTTDLKEKEQFLRIFFTRIFGSWWTDWCRYTGSHWVTYGYWNKSFSNEKIHNQGNIITTDNALDLAIDGDGFFRYHSKMEQLLIQETVVLNYQILGNLLRLMAIFYNQL